MSVGILCSTAIILVTGVILLMLGAIGMDIAQSLADGRLAISVKDAFMIFLFVHLYET
jgi:hypothetical protein